MTAFRREHGHRWSDGDLSEDNTKRQTSLLRMSGVDDKRLQPDPDRANRPHASKQAGQLVYTRQILWHGNTELYQPKLCHVVAIVRVSFVPGSTVKRRQWLNQHNRWNEVTILA